MSLRVENSWLSFTNAPPGLLERLEVLGLRLARG
jgi:hypothetical protein